MQIKEKSMRGLDPRCHGVDEYENSTAFIEAIRRKGWFVLPTKIPKAQVIKAKDLLHKIYAIQAEAFPVAKIYDENVVRAPFAYDNFFFKFIFNKKVLSFVQEGLSIYPYASKCSIEPAK
jgi:hypothetical protein